MKLRDFIVGFATGIAAGYLIKEVADRQNPLKPANMILSSVKESFRQDGPIDGSWIYMKPEVFHQENVELDVYRGGISKVSEGTPEHFEFLADARTGTIVQIEKS
ncbi:hypothetical protein [Paenisporosarcina cavernae]|uniref:Peptidase M4 n=1 Tax=Paenisporosarcina cavernae TaxID=2320858 RepID=A0A385YWG9_9BACL|nr:hypothetical protein [Paenisporosarcina cavernae]AYC29883.1 hypothetical protein D3873_08235 [Paenisporosarcina cavernae]